MKKMIEVVPYDPNWLHIFEKEASLIRQALGDNCLVIHHIGSTSVPGLAAKCDIDVLCVVNALSSSLELSKIGYISKGEFNIPLRYFFSKNSDDSKVNLHVVEKYHGFIGLQLCFRDFLRNKESNKQAYQALKYKILEDYKAQERLKNQFPFPQYTLQKNAFIKQSLRDAGYSEAIMNLCLHEEEWVAAKHFRDTYFFGPHGIDDPYTWTFNHEDHAHLVLYQGVDIISYVHVQFWPDKRAAIRIIAVNEGKRNQNVGSVFLGFIEKWLKTLGFKSIHTESRQASLRFYLKNGYKEMPFDDPEGHESDPNYVPFGKIL